MISCFVCLFFFFFNDTATTEIYTLSLHDALPIFAPTMADVPLKTNPLPRSKHPAASVCASASLQPTHTGTSGGNPNRRAAAAVTVPHRAHAAATGGQAPEGQPHAESTATAGAPSVTRQMPLDDQGSEAALPVSHRPTRSFGCSSHRVRSEEHTSELQSRRDLVCR